MCERLLLFHNRFLMLTSQNHLSRMYSNNYVYAAACKSVTDFLNVNAGMWCGVAKSRIKGHKGIKGRG
jgi:hypothetical protein